MFTGIVEETGTASIEHRTTGARITVKCHEVLSDATEGCSIAVNGVCLTALALTPTSFSADLAPETLRLTNLGDLTTGALVNLERPVLATGRLSGHVVQGHVDGTGIVKSLDLLGNENWWLEIEVPAELERYVIHKGSIAIDGISLTVARIENRIASITIIPHTYEKTALRQRRPGQKVNLECDVIAKYVEKLLRPSE